MPTITALMSNMKPGECRITTRNINDKNWYFTPWYKGKDNFWYGEVSTGLANARYLDTDHEWVVFTEQPKVRRYYKYVIQSCTPGAGTLFGGPRLGRHPVETGEYFPDEAACVKSWTDAGHRVKVLKRLDNNFIDLEGPA